MAKVLRPGAFTGLDHPTVYECSRESPASGQRHRVEISRPPLRLSARYYLLPDIPPL